MILINRPITIPSNTVEKIIIIITSLLITGCASYSHPDYPKDWSKLIAANKEDCLDISGVYADRSEQQEITLSWLLYGLTNNITVSHVSFRQYGSRSIKVIIWNECSIVKQALYDSNQFKCTNKEVILASEKSAFRSQNLGLNYTKNHLMKNEEGHLVVKHTRGEYGLIGLLLPVASETDKWYSFDQYLVEIAWCRRMVSPFFRECRLGRP